MVALESLSHTKWECKYHIVFIPKCRKKVLYGQLRRELGPVFRELAERTECRVEEGHLMPDHVHMLISIPPKVSVAAVMGFMKGKSAIHIARVYAGRRRSFVGQHSGPVGIGYRLWGRTKRRCVDTSGSRRRKTCVWINWN